MSSPSVRCSGNGAIKSEAGSGAARQAPGRWLKTDNPVPQRTGLPAFHWRGARGNGETSAPLSTIARWKRKRQASGRQPRRLSRDLMDPSVRLEMDWEGKRVSNVHPTLDRLRPDVTRAEVYSSASSDPVASPSRESVTSPSSKRILRTRSWASANNASSSQYWFVVDDHAMPAEL